MNFDWLLEMYNLTLGHKGLSGRVCWPETWGAGTVLELGGWNIFLVKFCCSMSKYGNKKWLKHHVLIIICIIGELLLQMYSKPPLIFSNYIFCHHLYIWYQPTNIALARGGAHLPIAHVVRLLSTQELRFGLTKLQLRKSQLFCF